MLMRVVLMALPIVLLPLAGCSTVGKTTQSANTAVQSAIVRQDAPGSLDDVGRAGNLGDALMTPASDLNIRKADIPLVLVMIDDPYENVPESCGELRVKVAELDAVLGPDYDVESESEGRTKKAGLGLVSSAMGDLIPFRGLVRQVSGAKKRERNMREAFRVGNVRRGYLKGIAAERDCDLQAF